MKSRMMLLFVLCAGTSWSAQLGCAQATPASAPKSYHARGTVRSFGAQRAYVNIAHEAIPGYMGAMTMSFEPEKANQLEGLEEGDRVVFEFVETKDARRVIRHIEKAK